MNVARDPVEVLLEHAREAVAALEEAVGQRAPVGHLLVAVDHLRAAHSGASALLAELDRPGGGASPREGRDYRAPTAAEIDAVSKSWAIENARTAWNSGQRGVAWGYVCRKPRRLDKHMTVGCGSCVQCRALRAALEVHPHAGQAAGMVEETESEDDV